jgi:hypothetical protein
MARHGKKDIDERLLMALACGATVETAARSLAVSERTVYRRLADPAFRQRLQQMRADMVQRTAGALTAAGAEAVRTLLALQKETVPPAVRLGAARAVLELGAKMRETAELEARIAALEEQAAAGAMEH